MAAVARHGKSRRANLALVLLKGLALALAVVLVSGASIAAIAAWDLGRQIKVVAMDPSDEDDQPLPEIDAIEGGVNLLIVGSDYRDPDAKYDYGEDPGSELNDVNILLHISEDHTNAVAVSFPRDTYVSIPECNDGNGNISSSSYEKINQALFYGGGSDQNGLNCAVKTVEELTGLDIPFAAEVTFDGVIEMSNAVGGVSVCVAARIEDTNTELYLDKGTHVLQGVDALKFLRTRYGVGDGSDVTRISSQQVFLSALIRKVKATETLTDISKLYGLAGAAVRNMRFTESLANVDTMVQIAKALQPIDLSDIVFAQFPTGEVDGGLEPSYPAAEALFKAIKKDKGIKLSKPDTEDRGAVDDPDAPEATETPDPDSTDESDDDKTELTGNGQTAADYKCTVGRTLQDQ